VREKKAKKWVVGDGKEDAIDEAVHEDDLKFPGASNSESESQKVKYESRNDGFSSLISCIAEPIKTSRATALVLLVHYCSYLLSVFTLKCYPKLIVSKKEVAVTVRSGISERVAIYLCKYQEKGY